MVVVTGDVGGATTQTRRAADVARKTRLIAPQHLPHTSAIELNFFTAIKCQLYQAGSNIKMNLELSGAWIVISIWIPQFIATEPISFDAVENSSPSFVSIFSPRMDFDQWKPLTGRGDPLRNDPTYDYEPPVLERVHYWADETRLEREHYPDRKSEVLMLGVSSRKPSVVSRPAVPPRKHHRPPPSKYEDYTYKFNDNYPMTILVPPPPPPPGHKHSLYVITDDKLPIPTPLIKVTDSTPAPRDTTTPNLVTTYALQEANLIYQSSTLNQNWLYNSNETKTMLNNPISSDYAGWGPTTPFEKGNTVNESQNLIFSDHKTEFSKEPYQFYKPMLSESPPPKVTAASLILPTFIPTLPQPTVLATSTESVTLPFDETMSYNIAETQNYIDDITTTEKTNTFMPTAAPNLQTKPNVVDMMSSMMSMPITDSERPEDNLYAHASETIHIFKDHTTTDDLSRLEVMQTMLPPPFNLSETVSQIKPVLTNPRGVNNLSNAKPATFTHDPYLHMRFTTTTPTPVDNNSQDMKTTTEASSIPMYLIIQGHSKVKTYGSKPKLSSSLSNEIPRVNETTEVKHLHPIKNKQNKNSEKITEHRAGRAKNLKSLVDNGLGSIEIQETDIGIKYDVSDGSNVPVEIYRKGIVDSEENNYSSINKSSKENRAKRQIDLEDLLPFDEDTLEEYIYNFFKRNRNETGITGLIAQAITSDSDASHDEDNSKNEDR